MSNCQITSSGVVTAGQSIAPSWKDVTTSSLPSKIPRYEKSTSLCSISDDSLTKHLTALWERDDAAAVPATSAATPSRVGSKRKAASVSSYLSDGKPDLGVSPADTSSQPSTTTILSQLLSSFSGVTSSPVNSVTSDSLQLSLQKNILLQNAAAAAKQSSSVVNPGSLPQRWSATESTSASTTSNIFQLPTYEQVIGNRATLSSPLAKAENAANDVFPPSPLVVSSSPVGTSVSSLPVVAIASSTGGNSALLLNQSTTSDSAAIASHIQLDDSELLRQLEQILSEPGLSVSDIDNVLGGCLVVPPSLPQSLSAVDQKAISQIQSQLMSVETTPSPSSVVSAVSTRGRNGTLCQLLAGKSPLTSDILLPTDKSGIRSQPNAVPINNQLLMSNAVVKSSHNGSGQYLCVLYKKHVDY